MEKLTLARCILARRFTTQRLTLSIAVLLSITLLTTVLVSAADSDLDLSFDGDGIVTTDRAEFEQINDMVIQPDGKIVAVGQKGVVHGFFAQSFEMIVARYNSDGSLDSTFGDAGIATFATDKFALARSVALQADGKIVVGGMGVLGLDAHFMVVRYNPDGSRDATFGVDGVVLTPIDFLFSQIFDLAVQADGKIIAVGDAFQIGVPFTLITTLVRYETNGSLDLTFDGDGISQAAPPGFSLPPLLAAGVALQADQKIVVAQSCLHDLNQKICTSRYNTDGSLDTSFDGDGVAETDFDSSLSSLGLAVGIQPDGKIVAAGHIFTNTGNFPGLARYNADGSFDNTFDGDGRAIITNPVQFLIDQGGLTFQPNGKIVIAGKAFLQEPVFHSVVSVIRVNTDGSPDNTFGSSGLVTTEVGTVESGAGAVAVDLDGRIVAGGFGNFTMGPGLDPTFCDLALVRYSLPSNQPPVVTITGPPSGSAFAVNTPVNFTGSFTDDPGDTHLVEWIFESLTQPQTIAVPVLGAPSGSANTTHTFSDAGIYKVSLRVTDNNFLSTTATTVNGLEALVVIFDPNGGWVNGGGWINSPAGAFAQMPALTGKAHFSFVSRYKKNASVPTGHAQFRFDSLNFQSTTYDWLVVSGNQVQCQGAGTINGSGSYQFTLTLVDGDQPGGDGQDKFRIRIWSESGVIYDNQLTVLGGGNISIH